MTSTVLSRKRWPLLLFCSLVTALGLLYGLVGDRTVWGTWLTIGPSGLWALLLLPTAVRLRSWLAAAFLVVFVVATSDWPMRRGGEAPPGAHQLRRCLDRLTAVPSMWYI